MKYFRSTSRPRPNGRSAFTLWEILIACTLLGAVGIVSTRAFVLSLKTTQKSEAAHTMLSQWEQMTRLLRQDMWAAQSLTVTGEKSVSIRHSEAAQITWTVDEDGSVSRRLSRGGSNEEHHWNHLQRTIRFAADGPQLLLTATTPGAPADQAPEQLRLAPALKLLGPLEARP